MAQTGCNTAAKRALKRGCDIAVSALGLVILSPLLAAIAVATKLDSPGPLIYQHTRIGQGGKPFRLYKFRSMVSGGDDAGYMKYLKELIESERDGGSGRPYRKMGEDPRVTRVGRVLRRTYLDELPQLWNVLRGDMSIVGPRPHVQFEVGHYTDAQRRRLEVKPGCTGLWQVAGKAECTFSELIALDLEYIDSWSLGLDARIFLRTALAMAHGGKEVIWARLAKRVPGADAAAEAGDAEGELGVSRAGARRSQDTTAWWRAGQTAVAEDEGLAEEERTS